MRTAFRPMLTWRRVIVGAVLLVLVMAVAEFVFGIFDGEPAGLVKVTVQGFESRNGMPTMAVLTVTTLLANAVYLLERVDGSETLLARFSSRESTRQIVWQPDGPVPQCAVVILDGFSTITNKVLLPQDGRRGRLEVRCWILKKRLPRFVEGVYYKFVREREARARKIWVECEQEIQCPRVLPDGTVEPPRLLPAREKKP